MTVPTDSTIINSNDPWDALSVDPHGLDFQQGLKDGQAAGLQEGYQLGHAMGRTTAIDVGLELGFVQGTLSALLNHDGSSSSVTTSLSERAQKTITELSLMIDAFPGVDQVFQEQVRERNGLVAVNDENNNDDSEQTPHADDTPSVRIEIQRIRAKFKLLTVQLGCPHFSLKQVMDDAAKSEDDVPAATDATSSSVSATAEW
jgi:hypothetical protein